MNNNENPIVNISSAIEAILYAAGHPVAYDRLCEVLGLGMRELRAMLDVMKEEFNSEKSRRGIMLLTFPDSCQLATKEEYMPYIREALGIKRGGNLSASSLEALAVVAYNQPVTRSDVDNIRGVDSSYAMTSLIDKNLIEVSGRLEAPGRPMLYVTTEKFLRVFGLSSLDELPETELIAPTDNEQSENNQDESDADGTQNDSLSENSEE